MTDLVVRGGRVHTAPGTEVETDLLVRDGFVTTSGPSTPVLDASAASVVPPLVQSAVDELPPGERDAWWPAPASRCGTARWAARWAAGRLHHAGFVMDRR